MWAEGGCYTQREKALLGRAGVGGCGKAGWCAASGGLYTVRVSRFDTRN